MRLSLPQILIHWDQQALGSGQDGQPRCIGSTRRIYPNSFRLVAVRTKVQIVRERSRSASVQAGLPGGAPGTSYPRRIFWRKL